MGVNQQRRQRKIEKQRAKKKAEQRLILRRQSQSISARFKQAPFGGVIHCAMSEDFWSHGMGHLWIGRSVRNSEVAFADFLIDGYCLGVKDCLGKICSSAEYQSRWEYVSEHSPFRPLTLDAARKLIDGALAFAANVGFEPHPEYRYFQPIFAGADPANCPQEFSFGRNGKPCFIQGPNDSPQRCREIIATLQRFGVDDAPVLIMGSDAGWTGGDEDDFESPDDGAEFDGPVLRIDRGDSLNGDSN